LIVKGVGALTVKLSRSREVIDYPLGVALFEQFELARLVIGALTEKEPAVQLADEGAPPLILNNETAAVSKLGGAHAQMPEGHEVSSKVPVILVLYL
jgi:hypothetical protein